MNTSSKVRELVLSSLLIALVYVATNINFKLPLNTPGGLVHLGNIMLFTATILFGKKQGAIAGAFGMALFDLLSPYAAWAPFTFVIRGIMGYMLGSIAWGKERNGNHMGWNAVGMVVSGIWMIIGYFIASMIMYGDLKASLIAIPGDITQLVIGIVFSVPVTVALKQIKMRVARSY